MESGDYVVQAFSSHQSDLAVANKAVSTLIIEFSAFIWLLSSFHDVVRGSVIKVFCDNQGAIDVARKGYHAALVMGSCWPPRLL